MSDPTCQFAEQHILHGEEDRRPPIIPIATALHIAVSTAAGDALGRYFDNETVKNDSTFYVDLNGIIYQFGPVNRKANAQFAGNAFNIRGRVYGTVSIETAGMGGPLTAKQLVALARLYAWLHTEWGISLSVSTEWNGPGAGWHSKYPEWNQNAHACPGPVRVDQLVKIVLPRARRLAAPPAPVPPQPSSEEDPLMAIVFRDPRVDRVYVVEGGKKFHIQRPALTALQKMGATKGEPIESIELADLFPTA